MKNLRKKFEKFCYRNRDRGIPNLMLYIVIGCGIVTAFSLLGYGELYELLSFDREKILQGQIWRLVTYVFTVYSGDIFWALIILYCAYSLGRAVEQTWGTCKFTLFYLFNILVMDLFAMLFGGNTLVYAFDSGVLQSVPAAPFYFYETQLASFLHLSMVICFATMYPEAQFTVFFVIPIKAKVLSLIYLAMVLFNFLTMTVPVLYFPHNLFPLVAMSGYFLFFGSDIRHLLPLSWQVRRRKRSKAPGPNTAARPTEFRAAAAKARQSSDCNHRCTVCGRTDVSNPELEFRYCSRCNGYYCYCQDHISNHTHIE